MSDVKEFGKASSETFGEKLPNRRRPRAQRDIILNGYPTAPHYISGGVTRTKIGISGAGNWGGYKFQDEIRPMPVARTWPHTHPCNEYFIFFGADPDKPDDIGGTTEFWIGPGEDSEPYIITKPTIVNLPPYTFHLPQVSRGYHGLNLCATVHDAPFWSIGDEVNKLHPGFSPHKLADPQKYSKKYQKYVHERDISMAAYYLSHEGKVQVLLHHDMRHDKFTTHTFEFNLVSGAGIGWGCGDLMQFSKPQKYSARSLPHIHDALEVYFFFGTDPDNPNDLGGTVEFWMGKGEDAKKITINKQTYLCIPPYTVHLPMWVSELHRPFVMFSMLDSIVWTGQYIYEFPTDFKHISEPKIPQMKLNFKYDKAKCTYPQCHFCMDICPAQAIDLSVEPRIIGRGCQVCGCCELFCPTGAMGVDGVIEA